MINWNDFQQLCKRELALCKVKPGETVIVLSQGSDRMDYADAFVTAAIELGAQSYNLRLGNTASVLNGPGLSEVGINPLANNPGAMEALKQADLVVDLVFMLWSEEQHEIQRAGARVLTCIEPKGLLAQMFPTEDQRRRVEFSSGLISQAKTMRITSKAGTDVTYQLGAFPVVEQYGYTDQKGRWDAWPGGFVFTAGAVDGVDGTVVIDAGDIIAGPFRSYVDSKIELTIAGGQITRIDGGVDAEQMKAYLDGFNDPRAYAISHIGWGINENVSWTSMKSNTHSYGQEARAYYGNVLFATGPNTELGGVNDTPAHMDIPLRNCTLYLDDQAILVDGEFVLPELKVSR
ncbi:2,5-dihydroxypyridine 5,6-dioxygenase [Eoetvoesiella caeni]|uniref:2,5-dihydroxypyridine 5,6-dioxygenase n=2 Tax=Eoetvoesiella caeni TaxID=645616 RepID=A0A366H160_9BURK|nr:2,5-dihydroxypyridine 5,6-dioxygenase [Eoetvoesiella caeni]